MSSVSRASSSQEDIRNQVKQGREGGSLVKRNKIFPKMISAATSCFPNASQGLHMYDNLNQEVVPPPPLEQTSTWESQSNSLLYTLSLLKQKVQQVESLITIFISPNQTQPTKSTPIAMTSMGSLVQEIMVTSSSLMFTCQQMTVCSSPANNTSNNELMHKVGGTSTQPNIGGREERSGQGFYVNSGENTLDYWYTCDPNDNDQSNINVCNRNEATRRERERDRELSKADREKNNQLGSPKNYDIVELDAEDLLAKYTHYCNVCGKGFKRDANLRMHMRAHGDEYKSSAALTNPTKNLYKNISGSREEGINQESTMMKKYSCPQEGCRWNKKHAKFQPLKSMICVKNHYKRSHCPKMYVCKRCNRKQFSVLSDLRTHEKHCGDLKWVCSCGTTFSRKDKLLGHCALFVGHSPAIVGSTTKVMGKVEQQRDHQVQMSMGNR